MIEASTEIGGEGRSFPSTRWSVIRDARDPTSPAYRQSLENLAAAYWKPVYAYFRRKWNKSNEEAKDLTQEFFAALCENGFLRRVSSEQGRFRSYVLKSLDNFVRLRYRHDHRQKRGGRAMRLSWDKMEEFEPLAGDSPEEIFLREWARSVLDEALEDMKKEYGTGDLEWAFQLFLFRDIRPPKDADVSYEGLARRFGMSVTDVTNHLYRARKKLREKILNRVRDTVTSEEEAEGEMKELFGA